MSEHAHATDGPASTASGPQLVAYADRFGGSLAGLRELLVGPLAGCFDGVHVLPFYVPFDGTDAGFDPEDHTRVDARLGSWHSVQELAHGRTVMADLIVNHMSSRSARFLDVLEHGQASPWAGMFLTMESVFPEGATEQDLVRIYRPRPGLPFTPMVLGGRPRLVWTTFTSEQVDLDIRHPATWAYLTSIIDALTHAGVSLLRLDAVGYAGKERGTDCFMTAAAFELMDRICDYAHQRGAKVLVEVHGHYKQQVEIARSVDYVYDFALPPLVLHTLFTGDPGPLAAWLDVRPPNTVTVLDTHDGIGIVDVGPSVLLPGEPGLLDPDDINRLVETIHENSTGTSRLATGAAASNLDLYQVNCTFFDALAGNERTYLLARLLQLFTPGIPQVYYVGLLAGRNDLDLLKRSGVGRDVNRHQYAQSEVTADLQRPVVRALLEALRLRSSHPAFGGAFTHVVEGPRVSLRWERGSHWARLDADVAALTYAASFSDTHVVLGPDLEIPVDEATR